jgi:hypothetical protein
MKWLNRLRHPQPQLNVIRRRQPLANPSSRNPQVQQPWSCLLSRLETKAIGHKGVSVSGTLFRGLRNAFRRLGNAAASLLGIGFFVRAVRFFTSCLLSRLRNVGRAFGKMLSVLLLFVYKVFFLKSGFFQVFRRLNPLES